jgi:hypothetical protein
MVASSWHHDGAGEGPAIYPTVGGHDLNVKLHCANSRVHAPIS